MEKTDGKKISGPQKGRAKKGGIEIPIVVVNKKSNASAPPEVGGKNFVVSRPKITKDEDDLPVFENKISNSTPGSLEKEYTIGDDKIFVKEIGGKKTTPEAKDKETRASVVKEPDLEKKSVMTVREKKAQKIGIMDDPKKREVVFIASVVLVVSLIFFVWIAILKNNLSFSLGPQNPLNFEGAGEALNKFHEGLDAARTEWERLESTLEDRKKAEAANQEVMDKIKEKVVSPKAETEEIPPATEGTGQQ